MWKCKYCKKDVTHINVCDDHYTCERCGKTPPNEGYFTEGRIWCRSCWQIYIAEKVYEWGEIEHDTSYQGLAICPYCGKTVNDSWELDDGDKVICGRCENTYMVNIVVSRDYSTEKIGVEG